MRKVQKNIIKTILIAFSVGIFASSVYAGVAFVGDFRQSSFASVKKLLPTIFTCPDGQGWYQGKCVKKCDQSAYPLTGTPDEEKGIIDSCKDVWGTYYTYIECHNGWDLIEGNCVETDCTGFNYTSEPTSVAGETESCKSGKDTFFKYTECHDGWDFNEENGMCSVHTCNSTTYPYNTDPGEDAGTVVTCKTGVAFQYGYSDCRTGWDKSNGYCNIHICDSNTFPYDDRPSDSIGTVISCPTGSDTKYGYSACTSDYELKNGKCETKCAYVSTSVPTGCSAATDSCEKDETTYYASTCNTCYTGYSLSDGTCNKTCTYTKTSKPSNCKTASSCKLGSASGTTTYYSTTCSTCNTSYYLSNGTCKYCSASGASGTGWAGGTLTSCPDHCNCSSATCGGITKYAISSAKSGYVVSCNRCVVSGSHACKSSSTVVGDIYYSDNTCSSEIISGKTPIGVVFDTNRKLVVALDYAYNYWNDGTRTYNDIPTLTNYTTRDAASNDFDGKNNTDKIVAYDASSGQAHEAAQYCHDMITGGKTWYLPAFGELYSIYPNLATINCMIGRTNGRNLEHDGGYHWSSTEYGNSSSGYGYTWIIHMSAQWLDRMYQLNSTRQKTRCVFAY